MGEYQTLLENELKNISAVAVIPRALFTHTTWRPGSLFERAASSALSAVTLGDSSVHSVTERTIIGTNNDIAGKSADTALNLAVGFFHKTEQYI